ncbi:MAG: laminin B domain-containing protein [Bacteroidota bacterium]
MKNGSVYSLMFLLGLLCLHPSVVSAQVQDDFENASLNGWYSEGDGSASLSSSIANPGSSLRVADNATGDINYAIAPSKYLGDWSTNLSTDDSISVDIYVESTDPDTLVDDFPAIQLIGPGGAAIVFDGLNLPRNVWNRISVPLDSSAWIIESGSWEALMQNVTLLRIRAEYITGDEDVYLDNIQLSLSPVRQVLTDTICSTFEDGTYDGWNFVDNGALSIDSIHGNPGIGIGIGDRSVVITQAIAPPKFSGDWSALLDSGYMSFDLNISTSGSTPYDKDYLVRLSGNGAVAQVLPSDSLLNLALNQWYTYTFLIDSSAWEMVSGTWDSLIVSVEEVRLELEFINGSEVASLDNFCLIPKTMASTNLEETKPNLSLQLFQSRSWCI